MPKFFIGPFQTGVEQDVEPFLLPEDAFPTLEDAFVFRGRVERRFGFNLFDGGQLNSRLRILIGTTAAVTGDLPAVVVPGATFKIGQMFSIGPTVLDTTIFTVVTANGAPAAMLTTGTATGTYDSATGSVVITGNNEHPSTSVFFYPSEPVMGLLRNELSTINLERTVGFDTQFSYVRSGTGWVRLPTAGAGATDLWTGANSQFYWSTNYRGSAPNVTNMYVVNNNRADHIRFRDANAAITTGWTDFQPNINAALIDTLDSARIILGFKSRLIVLNTLETIGGNPLTFVNRCRFSQIGDPTVAGAVGPPITGSWIERPQGGGFSDASTKQAIISAQFIQNRLIVFFERSTWELVYTGNQILPFVWQRISTELGAESTFSQIGFEDVVLGVGNRGLHAANPNSVTRIDNKIPDILGEINNTNAGAQRVYGIRDFFREIAMWTFPSFVGNPVFPNRVLVYNYKNNSFAFFNDSFTCYGYFQKAAGLTWATLPYRTWSAWTVPWNGGLSQAQFPLIIAGNQQGFTFLFEDTGTNDSSIMITDVNSATEVFTAVDHNLTVGQFIQFENLNGITLTHTDPDHTGTVFKIETIPSTSTFTIDATAAGTYTGGGTLLILNNINITTKNFFLFAQDGVSTYVKDIQMLLSRSTDGEVTVELFQDANFSEPLPVTTGSKIVLTRPEDGDTFSQSQDKIWHRIIRPIIGDSFQIQITMSEDQMRDPDVQAAKIILHGILLDAFPAGRLK